MITEVAGPSGSGKSTFVKQTYPNKIIYHSYCPHNFSGLKRFYASAFGLFYLFAASALKRNQLLWIIKKSASLEDSIFHKINAFRNTVLKFYLAERYKGKEIVVDEGISQIPFLLHLSSDEIKEFVALFECHLKSKKIVFLAPPLKEELIFRLSERGHKRARSILKAEWLTNNNLRVYKDYTNMLKSKGFQFIMCCPKK